MPRAYFDVGAPIFFNHKSFPKNFAIRTPRKGYVFLSHWDFDHYSLAVSKMKPLQDLMWFAPDQSVGPNAARLQASLGTRLNRLASPRVVARNMALYRGTGPSDDRNASGYALRIKHRGGAKLLTGDLSYDRIPPQALTRLSGLVIPHHGGAGSGIAPKGRGRAIVSYGVPNKYHHPDEPTLEAHELSGWTIERTAAHGGHKRQDRWL
jgi:beta-lactamase superfamily II metal-dependent hydrolase